jgi:hypothetical protein
MVTAERYDVNIFVLAKKNLERSFLHHTLGTILKSELLENIELDTNIQHATNRTFILVLSFQITSSILHVQFEQIGQRLLHCGSQSAKE